MSYAAAALPKLMRLAAGPAYLPTGTGTGLDSDAGNNPNARLSFTSVDPQATAELIDLARDLGGFASFSRPATAVRENVRRVKPRFELKPTTKEWLNLLPWVTNGGSTGTAPAAVTFSLATNRGSRRRVVLDYTSMVMTLVGCQVERATFAAQAGAELTLALDTTAVDFRVGDTFPSAGAAPLLDGPRFLMRDLAVSVTGPGLNSSTPPATGTETFLCRSFQLVVAYTGAGDRVFNSATDDPVNADREITLELELPLGAAQKLWGLGGAVPVAVTAAFVAVVDPAGPKTVSLTMTLPTVIFPVPSVPARQADREAFFRLQGMAHVADVTSTGDTELSIVVETDPTN